MTSCAFCRRTKTFSKQFNVVFFNFPKDYRKKLWRKACTAHCKYLDILPRSVLCSDHFCATDFEETIHDRKRLRLKKNSIPSRFAWRPFVHCIACTEIHIEEFGNDYHIFPKDKVQRSLWQQACAINGFNIKHIYPEHTLCSKHFSVDSFKVSNTKGKYLKVDAIPTIFLLPPNCKIDDTSENIVVPNCSSNDPVSIPQDNCYETSSSNLQPFVFVKCNVDDTISTTNDTNALELNISYDASSSNNSPLLLVQQSDSRTVPVISSSSHDTVPKRHPNVSNKKSVVPRKPMKIWRPVRPGDMREEHITSPREAKRIFQILSAKCKQYQRKLANYRTLTWKLKKKIQNLESLLSNLSNNQFISAKPVSK